MHDKFSLQIRQHVLLYNCKIAKNGKPLTSMHNLQQHTYLHRFTHTPDAGLEEIQKLLQYHRTASIVNNAYFWHLSSSLKKEKHLRPKWVFSSL